MRIGPVRIKSRELGLIYPIAKKNGNRVCDEVNNAVRFYANYFDIFEKNKRPRSSKNKGFLKKILLIILKIFFVFLFWYCCVPITLICVPITLIFILWFSYFSVVDLFKSGILVGSFLEKKLCE